MLGKSYAWTETRELKATENMRSLNLLYTSSSVEAGTLTPCTTFRRRTSAISLMNWVCFWYASGSVVSPCAISWRIFARKAIDRMSGKKDFEQLKLMTLIYRAVALKKR